MLLKFKKGEFARIQGQIVKIIDVFTGETVPKYKVLLVKGRNKLTTWVKQDTLDVIDNQRTPKVLYGTSSDKAS